ncbi:MAG: 8-oxoguanine DNA glycosylase [Lachnospiraceae bacterium]|nr:8-oxoguanine DNA glycosylase [Lachnospiraceae bacterium]
MIEKQIRNFDLRQIADSGQCFRWRRIYADSESVIYRIPAMGSYIDVRQIGDRFSFACDENEWQNKWEKYFDLLTDYDSIEQVIENSQDLHLIEAFHCGNGVRILQQDIWEMIITFMISQNNNIKRIGNSVDLLCRRCGGKVETTGDFGLPVEEVYTFPKPDEVPQELFEDSSMGFGYRAPFLKEMYEYGRINPQWLQELKDMSYEEAYDSLISHKGIGPKVANCICLFGLHHVDAFPIDTHVRQLLDKYYAEGFDFDRYAGFAGIIQQYLFYYELLESGK